MTAQALSIVTPDRSIATQVFGSQLAAVIKEQIARNVTDAELQYFSAVCERNSLDPFAQPRQIYAVPRWDSTLKKNVMGIQVGVDGLLIIADRTGNYLGTTEAQWCGADGAWRDVWLEDGPPAAARIGVYKRGAPHPIICVARYRSYAQMKDGQPLGQWKQAPDVMLRKCALTLALRIAFPNETSGVGRDAEIGENAAEPVDSGVIETTATTARVPDGEETRRLFWVKAQQMADEYGFRGADGKFKKSLVHLALGFAPEEGAITAWLDEGHSWPELIALLESLPPPGGEPEADEPEAPDDLTAIVHCVACGYELDECNCGPTGGPKAEAGEQPAMIPASRAYH